LPIGENSPNLVTLNIVKQLQGQSSEKIFYFRSDRIFHFLRRRCKCFAQLSDIDFAFLAIVFTRKKFKKKNSKNWRRSYSKLDPALEPIAALQLFSRKCRVLHWYVHNYLNKIKSNFYLKPERFRKTYTLIFLNISKFFPLRIFQ
jgi:hypothetical protein